MKVSRAIKELQKYNPDAEVLIGSHQGKPLLFVLGMKANDKAVWLESEDDCDLAEELKVRFEMAVERQLDELDFYMDLLEIGIDVECVRRYLGDEKADHMEEFCREHGLI